MKPAVEDNIAKAMATFIPDLKREYQDFVRRTLDRAKADLGPNLPGVYSSRNWHRIFRGTLSPNVKRDHPADYRYTGIPSKEDRYAYIIDEDRLEKNSQEYAEGTAYQWYGKMVSKLGSLDSIDIKYMQGGNLVLTGNRGSIEIRIDQQRIFKTSSLGTPFHQFPARIYVDGKFISEAEYKKMMRRSNSETDNKSKSNLRGGLQRTEHVRVPRELSKGKQGCSRGRSRHGGETGGILEVH